MGSSAKPPEVEPVIIFACCKRFLEAIPFLPDCSSLFPDLSRYSPWVYLIPVHKTAINHLGFDLKCMRFRRGDGDLCTSGPGAAQCYEGV
jgi:hypothetical protein